MSFEQSLIKEIEAMTPQIVAWRRDFHKHPESGWTEFRTASIVIKHLQSLGYDVTMGQKAVKQSSMMGVPPEAELKEHQARAIRQGADASLVEAMTGGLTGFWADLGMGGDGPFVAFRFDIDCNDVAECDSAGHRPVDEGFASVNPMAMHACGHDGHTAVGMALASLLAKHKDSLKGKVRLIFEPGEEGSRGAGPMADAGAVEGVECIFGFHVGFQAAKNGDLVCGTRQFLATTKWDVTFTGVSAHAAAAPQEGKNALLAACAATLNLHAIPRSGKGDTRITVGKLVGGQGRNVIPPNAKIFMETRGIDSDLDAYMASEAERIVKAAADMWGCTCHIDVVGGTKSGESTLALAEDIASLAKDMPCFTNVTVMKDFGATEDFSHLMTLVQEKGGKGTYIQVGTNISAGHHNMRFDFDEKSLPQSTELMARAAWMVMGK